MVRINTLVPLLLVVAFKLVSSPSNAESITTFEKLKLHVPTGGFTGDSGGISTEIIENPIPWVSERYRLAIFKAAEVIGLSVGAGVKSENCIVRFPSITGTFIPSVIADYNDAIPIASNRLKLPSDRLVNTDMAITLRPMATWIEAEMSSELTHTNNGDALQGLVNIGTLHGVIKFYISKAYKDVGFPEDVPQKVCN